MNNKLLIVLGSTLLAVLLILLFLKIPAIQVSYQNKYIFLKEDSFEIGWIHSVEKEPWFEQYEIKDGELFLTDTHFKTFGAGTPSSEEIIPSNDGFVHMNINRKIETINLFVSDNVKTTLYTEQTEIPLYELMDDYETVTIELEKIPLWRLLRGDDR